MKISKQTNQFAGSTSSLMVVYTQTNTLANTLTNDSTSSPGGAAGVRVMDSQIDTVHIAIANVGDCRAVVCAQVSIRYIDLEEACLFSTWLGYYYKALVCSITHPIFSTMPLP